MDETGVEYIKPVAKIISQQQAVEDCNEYIRKRMNGEIPLFKTCYDNINNALGGSIEPNTILTISGMSGSGKSTMSKRIIYSINENLKKEGKKCVTLCFNYEMLAFRTVGREIANLTKKSVQNLYSSSSKLSEEEYHFVANQSRAKLKDYEIYYVEEPGTHDSIARTIYHYWQQFCLLNKDTLFIVEIDHTLLIKSSGNGNEEKQKIDKLMEDLVFLKKKIASEGGLILFIVISQFNRNIESVERRNIPAMHKPIKSDLTQSDNVFQCSDYVLAGHQPLKLSLPFYTDKQLPTFIYSDRKNKFVIPFIYYHILKNRDGEPDVTCAMLGNLKYFEFIEVKGEKLREYALNKNTQELYLDNSPIIMNSN